MHIFLSNNILVSYGQITTCPKLCNSKHRAPLCKFSHSVSGSGIWGRLSWMIPAQGPSWNCHKALEPSGEAVAPHQGLSWGRRPFKVNHVAVHKLRVSLSLGDLSSWPRKPLYKLLSYPDDRSWLPQRKSSQNEIDRWRTKRRATEPDRWKVRKIERDTETDTMETTVFLTLETFRGKPLKTF